MPQPSQEEINDVLAGCDNAEELGSSFPGMTYEQGVKYAVLWMQGAEEHPLNE